MVSNVNYDYIDKAYQADYKLLQKDSYLIEGSPQLIVVDKGIVLPYRYNNGGEGGVIKPNGDYILLSGSRQEGFMTRPYAEIPKYVYHGETILWGGLFIKQWGHFVVDVLPRLWPLVDGNLKFDKIVFTTYTDDNIDGNYLEMLKLLGIKEQMIEIVKHPSSFNQVIVPELAMLRPDYYYSKVCQLYRYIRNKADGCMAGYKKVYFTRRHFSKSKEWELNEILIEKFFKNNGYKILSPEKLNLAQQLSIYSHAEEIASLSGTIPHNVVFCGRNCRFTIVNKVSRINVIQLLLNNICECDVTYVDCYIQPLPVNAGLGPFWLDITNNLMKFAFDNGMKMPVSLIRKRKNTLVRTFDLIDYLLAYFRIRDVNLNLAGEIIGKSRPLEEAENLPIHRLYFESREQIGKVLPPLTVIKNVPLLVRRKIQNFFVKYNPINSRTKFIQ